MSTAHINKHNTSILFTLLTLPGEWLFKGGKGKGFPYSTQGVGSGADPGVQAVSPQVTVSHPPGGRLPLLPPGLRLPPQAQSITALWPVPSYTAW